MSSVRRLSFALTSVVSVLFMGSLARAGDFTLRNVIDDPQYGKIFAFEEYGLPDGTGDAYSTYYFLDTGSDRFLPGTPTYRVIHEDQQVPASRNCPNGYRIGAIVAGQIDAAPTVALIQVSSFGLAGNDERWIAIPFRPFEQP